MLYSIFVILLLVVAFTLTANKTYAQCPDPFCIYLPIIVKPIVPGSFAQNSWPTAFQNFSRTGYNPYEQTLTKDVILANGLKLAWTYNLAYQPTFGGVSPIIATNPQGNSGIVYFPDDNIISLDLETGQPLTLSISHRTQDNITIDEQKLYYSGYANNEPHIIAANRHTGAILWTYKMLDTSSSAPTIYNNVVYVPSSDKNIYAIDKNSGALVWKYLTGDRFLNQTVAISGNTVYAKNENDALYAIDATTGQFKWSYSQLDGYALTSPAVHNDTVIIVDIWSVKALNATNGILKWEFDSLATGTSNGVQFYFGAPAVYSNTVYVNALHTLTSSNVSRIFALDIDTGSLVWKKDLPTALESSISIAAGILYIGADNNKIYALDATNGNELWSYQTGYYVRTFPAIANGKVIVASHDKKLYAFELP